MYEQYWGLNRKPFENHTDPEFFCPTETHHAALLKLRYTIENRLGAALLVGGAGHGKSCLLHRLEGELSEDFKPVRVLFPRLSSSEMLAYLAVVLGADDADIGQGKTGLDRTILQLERQLQIHSENGRQPTIIIDDAHLVEDETVFQTLQLLLNFRERPNIDFSLILAGIGSLLPRIHQLSSLDDHFAVTALLRPLSAGEIEHYVLHRLKIAGTNKRLFDETALAALSELSGGVPRKINRLCDLALLVGYAEELRELSARELTGVADELAPNVVGS